ncbi:MAG: PAS domain S-box protein, partial [Balneolales bacterium]
MISHLQACSILKALPNPSLIVTPEPGFPIRLVNQAYLEIVGIDEANLIGKTVEEVFGSLENKEDTLRLKAFKYSLNKVLVTKESHKMEPVKYCKPDSYTGMQQTTYWIPLNTPVFDKQGEIDFIIHSKTNITDQKLIEEQKSKALLNLRERVKGQSCLYRISNLNEKELSVDELLKEAVTILPDGWQYPDLTEAFIKYDDKKYITPHYTDTMWKLSAEAVVSNGATLAIKVVCLKKNPFPHGEQTFINTIAKHLALKIDQILAQENLERNQQILDKAYRLARIGTWEYDMSAGNLQWSQVTKRVYGLDNDHIPDLETTINLFKKGIDRTTYRKVIHDAIEYKIPFDVELKIISGQGDERWIRATGVPEYRNGVCTRLYGFSQNISERKKAVGELQFSERRFKALVQGGSDLIAIFDEEFRYTYMSPSSETVLGIPAGDLIGTYALENVHKDDKQRVVNDLSNLFATRKRLKIEPYRFADSKGSWRWIETTIINMIKDPTIGGLVTNSRDVTEQKLQQQQLLDSLKEKETLLA